MWILEDTSKYATQSLFISNYHYSSVVHELDYKLHQDVDRGLDVAV